MSVGINLMEQPASYIIGIDGTTYYAINCKTGIVEFSDTIATSVIQSAVNALTNGGKIFIKEGTYSISTTIVTKPYVSIVGAGYNATILKLVDGANCNLIEGSTIPVVTRRLGIYIGHLSLNGNKANQTATSHGIFLHSYRNSRFEFIRIDDFNGTGFYQYGTTDTFQFVMHQIMSYGNAEHGFRMTGSNNPMEWCFGNTNTQRGIFLESGYQNALIKCSGENNGDIGIITSLSHHDEFYSCCAYNNGDDGLEIYGSYGNVVIGGIYAGNAESGIRVVSTATTKAYNNRIIGVQMSTNSRYGYEESNLGAGIPYNNHLVNVIFSANVLGAVNQLSTTNRFQNAVGYVTENSGTVTIPAGSTSVDVTHGLDITPDINKIDLIPKDNLAGRSIWAEVHPTSPEKYFVIKMDNEDAVDHVFAWSYGE